MKLFIFIIVAVMLMVAYPVGELTRCIVEYNIQPLLQAQSTGASIYWLSPWPELPALDVFYMELVLIWGGYICIPFVLWGAFNLARAERSCNG